MVTKKDNNFQIKIGAIISYFSIIFNILVGFIYTPWLVREIGKSDYGLYTLAMSVITFFLMDFGISGTISRFISLYKAKNQKDKVENLLGITYKLYILLDIIIFIVLIFIYCFINEIFVQLSSSEIYKFKIIFIIVGLYSLISFPFMPLNGIFISYEKFIALKLFDMLQKIGAILFSVIALIGGKGLYSIVIINAAINIIVIILKNIYLKKKINLNINLKFNDKNLLKEILNFSFWMMIITFSQRLIINISPSILGIFSGAVQISIFSIGLSLESYMWMFANALNGLFLPKVTRLTLKDKDTNSILNLMIKVGRIQLIIIGILFVGLIVLGKEFMILWMGKGFENSYYVSLLLIMPGLITLTQEIAYNYLIAINEVKYRAYDFVISALISIILSLILTPKFGAIGAAAAAGVGIFIGHVIIMNIIYAKIFKLDILKFFIECHAKVSPALIITGVIGSIIQYKFPAGNLEVFIIKVIFLAIVYFIIIWVIVLDNYEKKIINNILIIIKNKIK
ncbi:oligosaccharide flippase family protein [Clostridium perfringens]|uniref:oligosaccharide flippase family protein n=1 Tax=Clostridium perfringens TaxID=1502 RepID=UPI0018ABB04C|nr:oligosaccharide flippase family protein [Clostridium perfringens]EJT5931348.1 oligosaccharide flippase family protein [Clostridium perfringens]EJT6162610.1 oligosaccharide flippase family protein [Clostridium perfringens]EJT6505096.1 oligosaccharide flippase family protein [Clostridium perfringens]HEF0383869.1 oligosaccharide flippase family protein [Clostridium perfringens]